MKKFLTLLIQIIIFLIMLFIIIAWIYLFYYLNKVTSKWYRDLRKNFTVKLCYQIDNKCCCGTNNWTSFDNSISDR